MSFFVWDNDQTAGVRNLNDEMSFTIGSNQVIRKQVYFFWFIEENEIKPGLQKVRYLTFSGALQEL